MKQLAVALTVTFILLVGAVSCISTLAGGNLSGQGSGGLWLLPNGDRASIENEARQRKLDIENGNLAEMTELEKQVSKAIAPFRVAFDASWRVLAVLAVLGIIAVGVAFGVNYASQVRPNAAGIFPLIRVKVGGATVIHDPNRALCADTVYTPAQLQDNVKVLPIASDAGPAQLQIAMAGAMVQNAAAEHRHPPAKVTVNNRNDRQLTMGPIRDMLPSPTSMQIVDHDTGGVLDL